jgi:puromycin-sensitive aminopeptidase
MTDRDFRLAKGVRPARYALKIDVDLDEWRFSGHESIEIHLAEPVEAITLHAIELEISSARLLLPDGTAIAAAPSFNAEAETVRLRFPREIPAGRATLEISFRGEIAARLRGFYRSQRNGDRYAATQFEAADARRAFPCFDEPEFKARFALTLTVPESLAAISNGTIESERSLRNGRKEVRFKETPPISSYLVAYTVGPYEPTSVAHTKTGVPVRVCLPKGMAEKGLYARDAHVRSLDYLEQYTAIPYPYEKVDAIGVPDFEAGAMENPGAITYRLTAIAADPETSSIHALKGIFYTAAHELTHMWWGDLVTMAWWDDLWLNESFATFIGYKTVADLVPEWEIWRDFVSTLTRPFNLDALVSTHPISFEVRNAKQATERFDAITYWKGAGVVRMIEGFLGAEQFRTGVRAYLDRYRERNATADDFWRELSAASGQDVAKIAHAWIRQPGHPLVGISSAETADGLTLKLTQKRFYADPTAAREANSERWPVPLVIKCGTDGGVHSKRILFDDAEADVSLPGARWFYPNADGSGFYRFALDESAIARLVPVIRSLLSPQERLDLIGNQWALLKAGQGKLWQFFTLLNGFRGENDRAVLSAITERLYWLGTHVVTESSESVFARFVESFYAPHLQRMGWDPKPSESSEDRQRRATVISALGELARSENVVTTAGERLEGYLAERTSLDPNLASTVVHIVARSGDSALYDRYLERKRISASDPEEEQRFLMALTSFENPSLVERTLSLSLTDEVRAQDRAHFLARALGSRAARADAWRFVKSRWNDLVPMMDPMLQQNLIRGLAQLTPKALAEEVRGLLKERATDETRETIAQALEQLALDVATCERLAPELGTVLAQSLR